MTDFIHEHPKEPQPNPAAEQETLPMDEKTGQKRVYGYIFILFIVAFALLVWAFLVNQRSTDQVLSELRGNADALQVTLTRNVELEREVDELEAQVQIMQDKLEALQKQNETLSEERDTLSKALIEANQQLQAYEEAAEAEAEQTEDGENVSHET